MNTTQIDRTAEATTYTANARECDRIARSGGDRKYLGRYAHEWDRLAVIASRMAAR